jgi:hypothetical protein
LCDVRSTVNIVYFFTTSRITISSLESQPVDSSCT